MKCTKATGSGGSTSGPGPFPESAPLFIGDRIAAKAPRVKSRGLLRRLAGRWLQILLLWLIISTPIMLLIHASVEPTYRASSLLQVEPAKTNIFGPLEHHGDESRNPVYVKNQVNMITSNPVLDAALNDPSVVNLPSVKRSEDPVKDLRENMEVEIIGDTNLLRITLELPDRNAAVAIVKAVTESYIMHHAECGRAVNRQQTETYEKKLEEIANEINRKRNALNEMISKRYLVAYFPHISR